MREGDPAPRYPGSMCDGWMPVFSMASASESYKALACMRGSEAVLMRGAPLVASLASTWSLLHLVSPPPQHKITPLLDMRTRFTHRKAEM